MPIKIHIHSWCGYLGHKLIIGSYITQWSGQMFITNSFYTNSRNNYSKTGLQDKIAFMQSIIHNRSLSSCILIIIVIGCTNSIFILLYACMHEPVAFMQWARDTPLKQSQTGPAQAWSVGPFHFPWSEHLLLYPDYKLSGDHALIWQCMWYKEAIIIILCMLVIQSGPLLCKCKRSEWASKANTLLRIYFLLTQWCSPNTGILWISWAQRFSFLALTRTGKGLQGWHFKAERLLEFLQPWCFQYICEYSMPSL